MPSTHDKFCSVPWLSLSLGPTGHYSLCCEADHTAHINKDRISSSQPIEFHWNGEFMKSIRRQFIEGEIPDICRSCKKNESAGIRSRRQRVNQRYLGEDSPLTTHPLVRDLLEKTANDGASSTGILEVDLAIGNTCQLRCIQCSPSYSRSVLKDYKKLGWDYNDKNRRPIKIEDRVDYQDSMMHGVFDQIKETIHSIKYIKFMGGEPTITRPLLEFLDWCIEHGHHRHLTILLCINAVTVSDKFIQTLQQFERVLLGISVDGVGGLDEWIRFPTNWERKIKNISRLIKAFPDAYINTTLCNLNIHNLPTLIEWCRSQGYRHSITRLNWPEIFSIQHFPEDTKKELSVMLNEYAQTLPEDYEDDRALVDNQYRAFIKATIEFMMENNDDSNQWTRCLETINSYNSIRPKTLQQSNPFFERFLPTAQK